MEPCTFGEAVYLREYFPENDQCHSCISIVGVVSIEVLVKAEVLKQEHLAKREPFKIFGDRYSK